MSERRIPPALEGLRHYLELETIDWRDVQPGRGVVVEAFDVQRQELGSFSFTVVDKTEESNGLITAHAELTSSSFAFVRDGDRQPIVLPTGTILRSGIACQHFPETNGYMSFLGGISVKRDYSFEEVMTPDGEVRGTILVPQVEAIYSFLPDGEYNPPASFEDYKARIAQAEEQTQQEYDDSVRLLDQQITDSLPEFFEDETTRQELLGILATFDPEARYKLAALLEYAQQDGVLAKYMDVLKRAIDEEFKMAPPGLRGVSFLPASTRGFNFMIRELGLRVPRPAQD